MREAPDIAQNSLECCAVKKKYFPYIKVMALSREEVEQRNRACKQRYYEKNREALLQKAKDARASNPDYNVVRREKYKERLQELIAEGVYQPAKRGRKALYHTCEEALEAKREQVRRSRVRHAERLAHAEAILLQRKLETLTPSVDAVNL